MMVDVLQDYTVFDTHIGIFLPNISTVVIVQLNILQRAIHLDSKWQHNGHLIGLDFSQPHTCNTCAARHGRNF